MPRSHVCVRCGTELARVRAAPDAAYGLPVVVCPGCTMATVRAFGIAAAERRTLLRLSAALHRLVLSGVSLFLIMIGLFGSVVAWEDAVINDPAADELGTLALWAVGEGRYLSALAVAVGLFAGAWAGSAIRPVPRALAVSGIMVLAAVVVYMGHLALAAEWGLMWAAGMDGSGSGTGGDARIRAAALAVWSVGVLAGVAAAPMVVRAAHRRAARRRWRGLRARCRAARRGG